jgi:glycosyltransferase involved in cell wall biosynthesis
VHFLGHRDDAIDLIPHFEVLLSTSGYEGQSNSVLEAMAAGVPVVATDIPGTRDLVVHGETGFLAPVGERAAFAKYILRLLDDRELAQRMGQAATERVQTEFSVATMVEHYTRLYRQVLG